MTKKTSIGGQALIEGILMRGPHKSAIVVRKPDGQLVEKIDETGSVTGKVTDKIPIVRGAVGFVRSMKYGFTALNYSADFFVEEEESETPAEQGRFGRWLEEKLSNPKAEKAVMAVAMVIGVAFPVALFILMPSLVASALGPISHFMRSLVEGVVRICAFLLFLLIVSRQKDVRRTFMYHGAEHKTIACYEAGRELSIENAREFTRFHPRCGTSFLFVVMIVSILFYSMFTITNPWARVVLRLALLPVVVGVSAEINRYAGRHDNALTTVLRAPGLLLQRFTTFEPDDSMIEVAITALERVIPENDDDKW